MALNGKHNRNDRRGQSLFTAARRPWPFFVARRRAAGAFFMRTPAVGAGGVHKSVTSRCSALIGACRGGHRPPSGTSPPPGRPACARTEPGVERGRRPWEPQTLAGHTSLTRHDRQEVLPWRERGVLGPPQRCESPYVCASCSRSEPRRPAARCRESWNRRWSSIAASSCSRRPMPQRRPSARIRRPGRLWRKHA
jgi:hypothetical protein